MGTNEDNPGLHSVGHGRTGDRLLTVEQVAGLLQVPPSCVYSRTRNRTLDRIPGFRLGKYWRFREAEVLAWLEQQRVGVKNIA